MVLRDAKVNAWQKEMVEISLFGLLSKVSFALQCREKDHLDLFLQLCDG